MGFEPTRAEHIGLAVQRLNHSATSSNENLHDWEQKCLNKTSCSTKSLFILSPLAKGSPTPGIEPGAPG